MFAVLSWQSHCEGWFTWFISLQWTRDRHWSSICLRMRTASRGATAVQRQSVTTVSMATSISDDTGYHDGVLQITLRATATDLLPGDRPSEHYACASRPSRPRWRCIRWNYVGGRSGSGVILASLTGAGRDGWDRTERMAQFATPPTSPLADAWRTDVPSWQDPAGPGRPSTDRRTLLIPSLPSSVRALSPCCRWLLWYLCQQWDRMALAWGRDADDGVTVGRHAGNSLMQ